MRAVQNVSILSTAILSTGAYVKSFFSASIYVLIHYNNISLKCAFGQQDTNFKVVRISQKFLSFVWHKYYFYGRQIVFIHHNFPLMPWPQFYSVYKWSWQPNINVGSQRLLSNLLKRRERSLPRIGWKTLPKQKRITCYWNGFSTIAIKKEFFQQQMREALISAWVEMFAVLNYSPCQTCHHVFP